MAVSDLRLPVDASAARIARSWIADRLDPYSGARGHVDEESRYDMLLCTSELVNASLMAGSTSMVLRLIIEHPRTVISLFDDCAPSRDPLDPTVHAQLFGLQLLDSLTYTWGISPVPDGREMWVEFTDSCRQRPTQRSTRRSSS